MVKEKWQGQCSKEEVDTEIKAPCGCTFKCLPFSSSFFWSREEDCPKHTKMVLDAINESNKRKSK